MKFKICLLTTAILLSSCRQAVLPRGNWEQNTYERLCDLIEKNGINSPSYDPEAKPYAVFDFDNTSVIGDVEHSIYYYQVENLRFKIKPEDLYSTLSSVIPTDEKIVWQDTLTVRMLLTDIQNDYKYLYDNYISPSLDEGDGITFRGIINTFEYQDFRTKMTALYKGISSSFTYEESAHWNLVPFSGMTYDEIHYLCSHAAQYLLSRDSIRTVFLESPETGMSGFVKASHTDGVKIAPEMKDLYKALRENGFDVYVCSASMEKVVETLACDPELGFGLPEENVYGLRLKDSGEGLANVFELDPEYSQTYKEGKTEAIKRYIAPSHGNKGPVLVAGDSNGDYSMLTSFDDMQTGLILDVGAGGQIGALSTSGDRRYVLQARDFAAGQFIRLDRK